MKSGLSVYLIFLSAYIVTSCHGKCDYSLQANLLPAYITFSGHQGSRCEWSLYTPTFPRIQVTLVSANFRASNCSGSYIEIKDGSYFARRIAKICNPSSTAFKSSGKYMHIVYHGGYAHSTNRFRLEYSAYDSSRCRGGYKIAHSDPSHINSLSQSGNLRDQNCEWLIDTQNEKYVVLLQVLSSSVGKSTCSSDSFRAFDGADADSKLLREWCGRQKPQLQSTGRYMYIRYTSTDPADNEYSISYSSVYDNRIRTTPAGVIAGAVTATIVLILITVCCAIICCKRKRRKSNVPESGTNVIVNVSDISLHNRQRSQSSSSSTSSTPSLSAPSHAPPPAYETVVKDETNLPPSYNEAVEKQIPRVDALGYTMDRTFRNQYNAFQMDGNHNTQHI